MSSKIVLDGYTLPQGVMMKSDVVEMQKALGVKADGIWGPKTQAAYDQYVNDRGPSAKLAYPGLSVPFGVNSNAGIRAVQNQLGTFDTGLWDQKSQNEYDKYLIRHAPRNITLDLHAPLTAQQEYDLDMRGYEWGIGQSDVGDYVINGYMTPEGVDSREKVKEYQRYLGVTADGIWGPRTQKEYERAIEAAERARLGAPNTGTRQQHLVSQQNPGNRQTNQTLVEKAGSVPSALFGLSDGGTAQGQVRTVSTQQGGTPEGDGTDTGVGKNRHAECGAEPKIY